MADTAMGVRLDESTRARLKSLAEKRDRSPHYLMKEALEQFLSIEEEKEAELELMRNRWSRYEVTGETISRDDMRAWTQSLNKRNR